MEQRKCAKCGCSMEQGFIPDIGQGVQLSHWHDGPPEKSFWLGPIRSSTSQIPIGAFRCSECGYLELYAMNDYSAC